MKKWAEVIEAHYREHYGEPSATFAIEGDFPSGRPLQLLYFPRPDDSTLLCTIGVHQLGFGRVGYAEILANVKGSPPSDLPFVYLNALLYSFDRLDFKLEGGLCVPVLEAISPAFVAKFGKSALLFQNPSKSSPVLPVRNGKYMLGFFVSSFITAAEAELAEVKGVNVLLSVFDQSKAEVTSLARPSAVEDLGRRPPKGWRAIRIPEGEEQRAYDMGARYDEHSERWCLPPGAPTNWFKPWLTLETRVREKLKGMQPRLVMSPNEFQMMNEVESPTAPPPTHTTSERGERSYAYELKALDESAATVQSSLLIHRGLFEYDGRFYSPSGRSGSMDAILCDEVVTSRSAGVHRRQAAEMRAFLGARSPLGADLRDMNEESISAAVLAMLEPHFEIERECVGRHPSGQNLCIDAILRPKDTEPWANKGIALGIEFKSPESAQTKGHADAAIMAQCLDYSFCRFASYPCVLVFACPLPPRLTGEAYLLRLLARYHVGFVAFGWKTGLRFVLGDDTIWREEGGVWNVGRKSMFVRGYGNRDR